MCWFVQIYNEWAIKILLAMILFKFRVFAQEILFGHLNHEQKST
jgi:hypothetical protein